jgi:hypothetical protein
MMTLTAEVGRKLSNPQLRCVTGACPWSAAIFVRLEDDAKRAVASFDVWGNPTTWELSAEETSQTPQISVAARVAQGDSVSIPVSAGMSAPILEVTKADGTPVRFTTGETSDASGLVYVGRKDDAGGSTYTYKVQ